MHPTIPQISQDSLSAQNVADTGASQFLFYADTAASPLSVQTEPTQELEMDFDSLWSAFCNIEVPIRPSMFAGHELTAANTHQMHAVFSWVNSPYPTWVFCMLVLFIALVVIFVRSMRFKVVDLLQATVNSRGFYRLFRENNGKRIRSLMPMAMVYVGTVALFFLGTAYTYPTISQMPFQGILQFLLVLGGCMGFFLARNLLTQLMGSVFENDVATTLYIANTYLFDIVGAFIFIPLLFFAIYSPFALGVTYTLAGILILLSLWRMTRGLQLIISNAKTSKFYLFYYLCILEIVPIIIVIKLLISY